MQIVYRWRCTTEEKISRGKRKGAQFTNDVSFFSRNNVPFERHPNPVVVNFAQLPLRRCIAVNEDVRSTECWKKRGKKSQENACEEGAAAILGCSLQRLNNVSLEKISRRAFSTRRTFASFFASKRVRCRAKAKSTNPRSLVVFIQK